jgi:hypothetical protein
MHEVALRLQRLARPDIEFATAVERFTRKGQLPSARRLCALAARMEREAYLTDDERSFLRVAPIEKLRRGRSPVAGALVFAATGALCFAAGSLGLVPRLSLRPLSEVTTLTLSPTPAPNVSAAAAQARVNEEKQRLSAELDRTRAELAQRSVADGERAAALTTCQDKLARCESNAERAGERSRTLASELEE